MMNLGVCTYHWMHIVDPHRVWVACRLVGLVFTSEWDRLLENPNVQLSILSSDVNGARMF